MSKKPTYEEAIDLPIIQFGGAVEMSKMKNKSQILVST